MMMIGISLMMLNVSCANKNPFVMKDGIDRQWVKAGQIITAPEDGVVLSKRAFKHYAKGCPK